MESVDYIDMILSNYKSSLLRTMTTRYSRPWKYVWKRTKAY